MNKSETNISNLHKSQMWAYEETSSMDKLCGQLLGIFCFAFLNHSLLFLVSEFIKSIPPGRKMVTSDINHYFVISFHLTQFSFYFGLALRVILGPLSYWTVFIMVELLKNCLHLSFAIFNISTFIQISMILNFEWVYQKTDKV